MNQKNSDFDTPVSKSELCETEKEGFEPSRRY